MAELSEAGQGLINGLVGESPEPKPQKVDDFVAPVEDEGPPVPGSESPLRADPVDPETGEVRDLKPDESPLDLKQLYKTEVHVDNGEETLTVTVGELKDMYRELHQVKNTRSETETARDEFAREQMIARQEFDAMVALLPQDAVTDEFREQTRERMQAHLGAETAKLMRIVPEWGDPQAAADDHRLIAKHAANYGFSADEIAMISDHRMVKYLLDNARKEQRLGEVVAKQADPKAQKPTPKPGPRSKGDKLADIKQAVADGKLSKREAAGQVLTEALTGSR